MRYIRRVCSQFTLRFRPLCASCCAASVTLLRWPCTWFSRLAPARMCGRRMRRSSSPPEVCRRVRLRMSAMSGSCWPFPAAGLARRLSDMASCPPWPSRHRPAPRAACSRTTWPWSRACRRAVLASYFALHGRAGLDSFRRDFLGRNVEASLRTSFSPANLLRGYRGGVNDLSGVPVLAGHQPVSWRHPWDGEPPGWSPFGHSCDRSLQPDPVHLRPGLLRGDLQQL